MKFPNPNTDIKFVQTTLYWCNEFLRNTELPEPILHEQHSLYLNLLIKIQVACAQS